MTPTEPIQLPEEVTKLINRLCSQRTELREAITAIAYLAYLLGKANGHS